MTEPVNERVRIFGIRHHGPGSARSLVAALEAWQPDALLVEGPPEANEVLALAECESMHPPVALLLYCPDDPTFAAYYPFAAYSPEWQAIQYGLRHGVPPRMMDLAQSIQMGLSQAIAAKMAEQAQQEVAQPAVAEVQPTVAEVQPPGADPADAAEMAADAPQEESGPAFNAADPLRMLAEAAGYSESEQWWEHLVEQHRSDDPQRAYDVFAAILEAMTVLRAETAQDAASVAAEAGLDPISDRREPAMRQTIRAALAEGCQRIAVVCGAWHAPALVDLSHEKEDAVLLKGLPRLSVQATWVPWTNARLTRQSGYGAGIDSPGWYGHLWNSTDAVTTRWLIRAARLLRDEDLDISQAHVIEAVRLAESLAALRGRPLPGLPELNEAALTIFCFGSPLPMRLIEEKLIVGDVLGGVPPETPMAPLQQDFERETRRLKLPPEATEKLLDLDLRKPNDLERSHLLHRLALLEVPWGKNSDAALQVAGSGRGGTFHEIWRLKWQPEFAVLLIEAGQWGSTLAAAASARVCRAADSAGDLSALTGLVEDVLLAELPDAIQHLMTCLQTQAAISSDIRHMMQALPPLAAVLRYGNVRQTDTAMIAEVVDGLAARICIGLPGACAALNDDAADEVFALLLKVDEALARLAEDRLRQPWWNALSVLLDLPGTHHLIAGRACRILLDGGQLSGDEAARRFGLALSTAVDPLQAAAWVEGFLRSSGQLLVHDEALLGLIDAWLSDLPEAAFNQLLPLLRRTFSTFARPERRSIGERVKRGDLRSKLNQLAGSAAEAATAQAGSVEADNPNFDSARADAVLPLLAQLLGIQPQEPTS